MPRGAARAVLALAVVAVVVLAVSDLARAVADPVVARRYRAGRLKDEPLVGRIHFVGNDTFDRETLGLYMLSRESGLFARHTYDAKALRRDLANLQRFYIAEGFLEAEVELADVQLSPDSTRVELLIGVYEGDRWVVADVGFEGNDQIPDDDLLAAVALKPGGPFRTTALSQDRRAVLGEYAGRSFLDAHAEQTVERRDDIREAAIRYSIVEREKAHIDGIDIEGDKKTRGYVIERELEFVTGDPFDPRKIGETQANLYRTGLFHSIWIEPAPADTGKAAKDIIVRVTERPSGSVDLSGAYAVVDGFEAGLSITNRNVQGQAITAGLECKYGERARGVRASTGDPWFLGRRVAAEAAGAYEWEDQETYVAETIGASFVLSKKLGRRVTVEGGYGFERALVMEAPEDADDVGTNYTSDVTIAGVYDSRDEILSARRGMFTRAEVNFASSRLGGTNDFVRYEADWRGFKDIRHSRVAALALMVGWITARGDESEVPVNERYLAGGEGTVRGFDRNSLGPVGEDGEPKGGRAIVIARGEVRFPVYKKLRMAAFVDAGQVFEDVDVIRASDLAVGGGIGLRFETRVGVLRADVATPLSEKGDPQYYFGIGQAF